MSNQETRELIRIRHDLRACLVTGAASDVGVLLARLHQLAEVDEAFRDEILSEVHRWQTRFDLLASIDATLASAA